MTRTTERAVVLFPLTFAPLIPFEDLTVTQISASDSDSASNSASISDGDTTAVSATVQPSAAPVLAFGYLTAHLTKTRAHRPIKRRRKPASKMAGSRSLRAVGRSAKVAPIKKRQPAPFAIKRTTPTAHRAQTRVLKPIKVQRTATIITFPKAKDQRQAKGHKLKRVA